MTSKEKEYYLNFLTDGFDTYIADGHAPAGTVGADDLLAQYVRDVAERNPSLGGDDPEFRATFKNSLQAFLSEMIDRFQLVDRRNETERMICERFMRGTPGERRALWPQVTSMTRDKYDNRELFTDGYEAQIPREGEERIFNMFAREWSKAIERRARSEKRAILDDAAPDWENACRRDCNHDFKLRKRVARVIGTYPLLNEIAAVIGQHAPSATTATTLLAARYRPSIISTPAACREVDRITTGKDLKFVIPAEFSFLAREETEAVFMQRFAEGRLSQFSSPGDDSAVKQPVATPSPRLSKGPIIVSLDTSSSMDGRTADISHALLYQLIAIARREKRPCYLITYSVRSKSIDLTEPGAPNKLDDFLAESYTGGTNGEQMLHDALFQLRSDTYRMADVLIISDFAFARPLPATLAAIRKEQQTGTCFYGLQIGHILNPYRDILDRIWTIAP